MFKKKPFKFVIGLVLTVLAIWLSFRNLDWNDLSRIFLQVNIYWVGLAVINILVTVYILGWRWQMLLRSKGRVSLADMFRFNIISQYMNIIIPARFGELLKAWLVSQRYGISGSYALGTVLIEKIIELFIVVILGVLAPLFFTFKSQLQLKGQTLAVGVFILLVPMVSLVIWKRQMVRKWLTQLAKVFPGKLRQKLLNFLDRGMEAFGLLKDIRLTLRVVLVSFLVLLSQVITIMILFRAFDLKLFFMEALVLQLVVVVGMSIPSVPGKIGIFEYTVILALSMFGVDEGTALSFGLMLHVGAYLPKIILGFVFMASLNISIKKAEAELGKFEGEVN
jgi:uncharacterized protein (TIRG00374 family)